MSLFYLKPFAATLVNLFLLGTSFSAIEVMVAILLSQTLIGIV